MATDMELADDASKQEIQEYVDNAVAQIEEDRKGEQTGDSGEQNTGTTGDKSDSQKVAEDHEDIPIAEDNTGDQEEETVEEDSDWLDEDLKAEVSAYGITDDELGEFTNREELDRALRFFDRAAQEKGREALAEEKISVLLLDLNLPDSSGILFDERAGERHRARSRQRLRCREAERRQCFRDERCGRRNHVHRLSPQTR